LNYSKVYENTLHRTSWQIGGLGRYQVALEDCSIHSHRRVWRKSDQTSNSAIFTWTLFIGDS